MYYFQILSLKLAAREKTRMKGLRRLFIKVNGYTSYTCFRSCSCRMHLAQSLFKPNSRCTWTFGCRPRINIYRHHGNYPLQTANIHKDGLGSFSRGRRSRVREDNNHRNGSIGQSFLKSIMWQITLEYRLQTWLERCYLARLGALGKVSDR